MKFMLTDCTVQTCKALEQQLSLDETSVHLITFSWLFYSSVLQHLTLAILKKSELQKLCVPYSMLIQSNDMLLNGFF